MIEELAKISQEGENWSQIINFSRYWISDLGRVYDVKLHKLPRIEIEYDGYLLVSMRSDTGECKSKRIHRLVAEAFLPDWKSEWPWTVNHINGIKDDNRLCNLEMLTTGDNSRHYQTADCFKEAREAARAEMSRKMKEKCVDPEYNQQMSDRMKKVWQDDSMREMYVNCLYERQSNPENRKQVSDKLKEICADPEYRKGMSERQKENWNNPEYRNAIVSSHQDRIWVNDNIHEKWIHAHELESYLSQGYLQGRLPTGVASTAGKTRISKGKESKFVTSVGVSAYLADGWRLGKANRLQVQCIETGEVFSSVEECAKAFGTNEDLIRSKCKGLTKRSRKLPDLHFRFYEEEGDK